MPRVALIVHGGAWSIPAELENAHLEGVRRAVTDTLPKLQDGCSALDAVQAAVEILEDDPTFDAGRGSFLNAAGEVELDAMIMDGATLRLGAVAAIQNILHPIAVARLVMECTEHCLLVGSGALAFARSVGIHEVAARELVTARELAFYEKVRDDPSYTASQLFEPAPMDTVGAVALDQQGNLAAATSTGGIPRKLPGRVGDSPLVGAGTYADNECGAASATGLGEAIMKVLLTKTACDSLAHCLPMDAARQAVQVLQRRASGMGGVILIDRAGNYGFAHNTSRMAFAYSDPDGEIVARLQA